MIVRVAYLVVILIWSTTPLAIQWSSQGGGYLFGVSARLLIGLCVLYVIFKLARIYFSRTPAAIRVYFLSGFGIYIAMFSVYWGAQFIPSGWIAIVYGLSPIVTGLFAHVAIRSQETAADWFGEQAQDPYRILDTVEIKTAWHPIGV